MRSLPADTRSAKPMVLPMRTLQRSRTRGCQHRGARLWLDEQPWQRQSRRYDQQRAGGRLDHRSDRSGTTATIENLFNYEWELTKSPAGAHQWTPKNSEAQGTVPDAHDSSKRHAPMMLTTDLALSHRSDLQRDLEAVLREPGRIRRRLRSGVVQANTPRYGTRTCGTSARGFPTSS